MKAILCKQYGPPDQLQVTEVEKPSPADNEVLIKVYAASVNPMDVFLVQGFPLIRLIPGLRSPKDPRLGTDFAGRVEAVGSRVTEFKPGDDVFGACRGAFAEYVCIAEDKIARKPVNISFEQAGAITVAAISALQGLRDHGKIQPGQKVLIDGASGGVGTFAVQIAKALGAEVTAVCSTSKLETARSIGADRVIDYTREDFTRAGQQYDLILAANAHHSIFDYRRALTPRGTFVLVGGAMPLIFQSLLLGPLLSRLGKIQHHFFIAKIDQGDLIVLKDLIEAGKVVPVIDRCYPLSELPSAFHYLKEKHARGKIVITIGHAEPN